ncbi:Hypothetical predicted protein [Lynx pardinus]|uniref:Uncharacterized protein n=1 Tax=Lynx pardinus TaxID=191816 RepID=A0A485N3Z4_LYNPA|nr:Hypothetical predicted protein [Lynx pardinus]
MGTLWFCSFSVYKGVPGSESLRLLDHCFAAAVGHLSADGHSFEQVVLSLRPARGGRKAGLKLVVTGPKDYLRRSHTSLQFPGLFLSYFTRTQDVLDAMAVPSATELRNLLLS